MIRNVNIVVEGEYIMTRDELKSLSEVTFKKQFIEILEENREIGRIFQDLQHKVLSIKVNTGEIPREKAEEILMELFESNQKITSILKQAHETSITGGPGLPNPLCNYCLLSL